MRCSVVFGVTLRLLVINISSSSPAINTAAYYQRCVITCDTLAVLHPRPRLQHLPVAALTQAVKTEAQNCDFCLPHLHSTSPLRGFPSEYCHPLWCEKKLEWCGYPMVKNIEDTFIRFDTMHERDRHTQTDRQTDRQTLHNGIGRSYA